MARAVTRTGVDEGRSAAYAQARMIAVGGS